MYRIAFTKTAHTQLAKLEKDTASRIADALERVRMRPKRFCRRLVGSAYYRLRVGDYRVILDIRDGALVVFVIDVVHRSKAYR